MSEGTSAPRSRERLTRQKRALAAVLDASDGFHSAQELFSELRARGEPVGLTTIYTQLRTLADAGEIDALRSDDGEVRYRRCATEHHHHHLVCRECGRTVDIEASDVESWATRIAEANGFAGVSHTIEVLGTCSSCTDRRH